MQSSKSNWDDIEKLVEEIIEMQHKRVFSCARQIVPSLTTDDILQPNDFPKLENHPVFRYEEGILHGMRSIQIALRALQREIDEKTS